jgi:murein DD-endopeptidase MepM/ murein hydrolase activator NlpD
MSNSFSANQRRFPWPVEHGVIIESFGTHPHPLLKNVTTKNNGVDIKTTAGSNVRTIFEGTVVNVLVNPGYHKAIIIRHGDYFTVYSNLESVDVKAGDKVSTKETIGKAFTDTDENITMVHLEIWKGTTLLDPESWLAGK